MYIRPLTKNDIPACARILMDVYNNELWQCRWQQETAEKYLTDYLTAGKFLGFAAEENGALCGALFAHEKVWWNNSEIFIDEMFVTPPQQGQGIGRLLMDKVEETVKERSLAGITLSTNRFAPAPRFYERLGFADCPHVQFMAKEI